MFTILEIQRMINYNPSISICFKKTNISFGLDLKHKSRRNNSVCTAAAGYIRINALDFTKTIFGHWRAARLNIKYRSSCVIDMYL